MRHHMLAALAASAALAVAPGAGAAESAADFDCNTVRFGQPNWTGVSIKTDTATWALEQIGYDTETTKGSLPIVYKAMAGGDLDVLLAQWMPSQREQFRKFGIEGTLDVVSPNLTGGRYTVAVPDYVYEAGVTSIADLDEHKERFGGEIQGLPAPSAIAAAGPLGRKTRRGERA